MKIRSLALAAALSLGALAAPAHLLTNGGVEDIGSATLQGWGGYTYGGGYSTPLPGWTVVTGTVDITITPSTWAPADTGTHALDLNGFDTGAIAQTFATAIGQKYDVSFAYSRNAAGAPDPATAFATAGGSTLDISAANDASFGSAGAMLWKPAGFSFTASAVQSTLTFTSTVGGSGGVFLDSISVTAVPEPETYALMLAGLASVACIARRRRSN
jgi:hypothetical protein